MPVYILPCIFIYKGADQIQSAAHFQQHSCRNGDECIDLWVVSQGATYQFQL